MKDKEFYKLEIERYFPFTLKIQIEGFDNGERYCRDLGIQEVRDIISMFDRNKPQAGKGRASSE